MKGKILVTRQDDSNEIMSEECLKSMAKQLKGCKIKVEATPIAKVMDVVVKDGDILYDAKKLNEG